MKNRIRNIILFSLCLCTLVLCKTATVNASTVKTDTEATAQWWNPITDWPIFNRPVSKPTTPVKKSQQITASSRTVTRKTKAFYLGAKTSGNGALSYSSSNNKVVKVNGAGQVRVGNYGKATITIRAAATSAYSAAVKTVEIRVVPVKQSLTVSSPAKKTMKIKWKRDTSVTGYQVYLNTRKNFKKGTLERKYKKSVSAKKEWGWKSKKVYYVKIRAYKKIGKTMFYGPWSTIKKVKIK